MTHTFKKAVLFTVLVSMGAASAVSLPKVSDVKNAVSAKARQFDAWQRRQFATGYANHALAGLIVAKVGQANPDVLSSAVARKLQLSKTGSMKALVNTAWALSPADMTPARLTGGFALPKWEKKHTVTASDDITSTTSPFYGKNVDDVVVTQAAVDFNKGFVVSFKPANKVAFVKAVHTAAIYTLGGLKAFNAVRDAKAKRAAAQAAKLA